MPNLTDYLQLGSTAVVSIMAFWSFVQIFKNRKNGSNNSTKEVLKELQELNNNHLMDLKTTIENGNRELRDNLHDDNLKIIEILSRIDGKLSKRDNFFQYY